MNSTVPKLRKHKDGRWITSWGGKTWYFGRDRAKATVLYTENIAKWQQWRMRRDEAAAIRPECVEAPSLLDLYEAFIASKKAENGQIKDYRYRLKRFMTMFGPLRCSDLRISALQALKEDMIGAGFGPATITHDITAVKTMLRYGTDQEIPHHNPPRCWIAPMNLNAVKTPSLPEVEDKSWPADTVQALVKSLKGERCLQAYVALNYLCAMRPSEVVRVALGEGEWIEPGVFKLKRGKTNKAVRFHRHVLFSDEALSYLEGLESRYKKPASYSTAFKRITKRRGGPHPLRHSAVTHLLRSGVNRADAEIICGHYPKRVSLIYGCQLEWQSLRESLANLTVQGA